MSNTKIGAKDFFISLGSIVSLYVSVVALMVLLFRVINQAFPQVVQYGYGSLSAISFQVATLIVFFPLFLVLSLLLEKSYLKNPEAKESFVTKWFTYITLFIAGAVASADAVTVIYYFLDGRDLTIGFFLKALSLFVVMGALFIYFIRNLNNKIDKKERNIWRVTSIIFVIGVIALGFSVVGSPKTQRMARYDEQKISDLQNIQYGIVNYWQSKGRLPQDISELNDPISGFSVPVDTQTKEAYVYKKNGDTGFALCATFNGSRILTRNDPSTKVYYPMEADNNNWNYEAGEFCFERAIDPSLYPVFKDR